MSIKDTFIKAIEDNVPPDGNIIYESNKVEIETSRCLPDRFIRKYITLSWVEIQEDKSNVN